MNYFSTLFNVLIVFGFSWLPFFQDGPLPGRPPHIQSISTSDKKNCPDQQPGPCEAAKTGAASANQLVKDTIFNKALSDIKNAFKADLKEHCITFGKNALNAVTASAISNGSTSGGTVPVMQNAFADLHNHPNNIPPDAGDLYGLIDINKSNPDYNTRFVVTMGGIVYALLVTDPGAAFTFNIKFPRQAPALPGAQPAFPVDIVDEFREIKYKYNCADETVMAFILEKYKAGVSLLKQEDDIFKTIVTTVSGEGSQLIFTSISCP